MTPTKPVIEPDTFGDYLKQLRSVAGFKRQADLARVSGVSHTMLSKWEDGTAVPSVDGLRRIAPHLGVRLGDLMVRAKIATREELGMVAAPPAPPEPLEDVEVDIHQRLDRSPTPRRRQALINHLEYALKMFDEVVAEVDGSPREPRMRRR